MDTNINIPDDLPEKLTSNLSKIDPDAKNVLIVELRQLMHMLTVTIGDGADSSDLLIATSYFLSLSSSEQQKILQEIADNGTSEKLLNALPQVCASSYKMKAKKPDKFLLGTSKAFQTLFHEEAKGYQSLKDERSVALSVGKRRGQSMIITLSAFTYENDTNIRISHTLSYFDKIVLDAVYTYFNQGVYYVTAKQIAMSINGNKEIKNSTMQLISDVEYSLENLSHNFFSLDYSEQLQRYHGLQTLGYENPTIKAPVLTFTEMSVTMNGQVVRAYGFEPKAQFLYHYNKGLGQVSSVPIELLDVHDVVNSNGNIKLKHYLLSRIEAMRHNSTVSNSILIDTIFKNCQIDITQTKQKSRYITTIRTILKDWQDREYIHGYIFEMKGRSYYRIAILL